MLAPEDTRLLDEIVSIVRGLGPDPVANANRGLAILAAGGETGWWDEHGQPAPFPDDFHDPDDGWRHTTCDPDTTPTEPPF